MSSLMSSLLNFKGLPKVGQKVKVTKTKKGFDVKPIKVIGIKTMLALMFGAGVMTGIVMSAVTVVLMVN